MPGKLFAESMILDQNSINGTLWMRWTTHQSARTVNRRAQRLRHGHGRLGFQCSEGTTAQHLRWRS